MRIIIFQKVLSGKQQGESMRQVDVTPEMNTARDMMMQLHSH